MSESPERKFEPSGSDSNARGLRGIEALTPAQLTALNKKLLTKALFLTNNHIAKAKDLVQETFVQALKYKESYTEGTNLEAWLGTILRNQHYSSHRRAKFHDTEDPELRMRTMAVSPEQNSSIDAKEIDELLEKVPERYRGALKMIRDGESYEAIGEQVGLSQLSLRPFINRARKAFAKVLDDAGYVDSDNEIIERFLDKEIKKK